MTMLNSIVLQSSQFAGLVGIGIAILFIFILLVAMIKRYKRCPSDRILVVYGKVGGGESAKCIHGGAAFIFSCNSRLRVFRFNSNFYRSELGKRFI